MKKETVREKRVYKVQLRIYWGGKSVEKCRKKGEKKYGRYQVIEKRKMNMQNVRDNLTLQRVCRVPRGAGEKHGDTR